MLKHNLDGFFNGCRQFRVMSTESRQTTMVPSASRVSTSRTVAIVTVGLVMMALSRTGAASEGSNQVWVVDTRPAPSSRPADDAPGLFSFRLRDGDSGQWQASDWESFVASDDENLPTAFFIHGNLTGYRAAVDAGWMAYRLLECQAAGRPFRFVVWSWPAERVLRRHRPDFQLKACRSDVQGCYLAQLINRMDPAVPVTLIGHSYGARAITGAAHVLSGGTLAGWEMPEEYVPNKRIRVRAILVAAALDNDWLLPGRKHGLALGQLDSVLLTRNWSDTGLKWYPLMSRTRGPRALGRTGPACPSLLDADGRKVETVNVACSVGRNHDFGHYMRAPEVTSRLAWYAFLESAEEERDASKDAK